MIILCLKLTHFMNFINFAIKIINVSLIVSLFLFIVIIIVTMFIIMSIEKLSNFNFKCIEDFTLIIITIH